MASTPAYMTKERLREIEEELTYLKNKRRPEIAQMIADARSHGDLSENAEYDAAKDAQGLLELQISKLEATLARVRIIDTNDFPNDKVYILSKVKIKNRKNNALLDYTLVGEEEADFEKNKIAITSPIGKALMGKVIGDVVSIKVPAGVIEYEILEISR